MGRRATLLYFLLLTVGGGIVIGLLTAPGSWYSGLEKPVFNPPPWIFGPVWTVLYVLVAVAGWRVWQRNRQGLLTKTWFAQIILNFCWSPVFFGLHRIGMALAIILLLLAAIASFILMAWRQERVSAWLFMPYLAWVGFATLLNAAIFLLN